MLFIEIGTGWFFYVTTPNFLIPEKAAKLCGGYNPSPPFDDYDRNRDAHFHFREYTVRELLSEITYVGGARVDVILSNCWDRPRYEHDNEMMYRSNICLVIRKTGEVGC